MRVAHALALVALGTACAHHTGADKATAPVQKTESRVRVNVTNHYSIPVDIYAFSAGIRQRLGAVSPGMVASFVLPQGMVGNGNVEFAADIGPSDAPIWTGEVQIVPGDVVDVEIATHPTSSTMTVHIR